MMVLITGGSKCGKSSMAERLLQQFDGNKYYLATMEPFGEEGKLVVDRHRQMRAGKGFQTIEQYTQIHQAEVKPGSGVLLECVCAPMKCSLLRDRTEKEMWYSACSQISGSWHKFASCWY